MPQGFKLWHAHCILQTIKWAQDGAPLYERENEGGVEEEEEDDDETAGIEAASTVQDEKEVTVGHRQQLPSSNTAPSQPTDSPRKRSIRERIEERKREEKAHVSVMRSQRLDTTVHSQPDHPTDPFAAHGSCSAGSVESPRKKSIRERIEERKREEEIQPMAVDNRKLRQQLELLMGDTMASQHDSIADKNSNHMTSPDQLPVHAMASQKDADMVETALPKAEEHTLLARLSAMVEQHGAAEHSAAGDCGAHSIRQQQSRPASKAWCCVKNAALRCGPELDSEKVVGQQLEKGTHVEARHSCR